MASEDNRKIYAGETVSRPILPNEATPQEATTTVLGGVDFEVARAIGFDNFIYDAQSQSYIPKSPWTNEC